MLALLVPFACGQKETDDSGTQETVDTAETIDTATEDTGLEGSTGGLGTTQLWSADTWSDLTETGGCSDYFVYAKNPEDTLTLHISGSGLALEAHQSDSGVVEYTYMIDPMSDDIQPSIVVQQGEFLNAWSCNDAAINESRVDLEHPAISGTVHVTVTAEGEMTDWGEVPATISIELTDICFDAYEEFCIESYRVDQYIGWMPG